MTLIVEDGTSVTGAEAYASVAAIDTYWTNRPHDPLSASWIALDDTHKEGAAREASDFVDSKFGQFYRGSRLSNQQGLLYPRFEARGDDGFELEVMPTQLIKAVCELAARASTERLSPDEVSTGIVQSVTEKVGPLSESTTYATGAPGALSNRSFGFVSGLLEPILNGSQPNASGSSQWNWN